MWTKVYLGTLIVFALLLGLTVYYAGSWLSSIGLPADAFAGYEYYRGLTWWILGITTVILLLIANVMLARTGDGWAIWATFAYFAVFVLLIGFLLPLSAIGFMRENGFSPELSQYLSPFAAVGLVVGFGVIVYLDHFIIKRMRSGLEPQGSPPQVDADESADESPNSA